MKKIVYILGAGFSIPYGIPAQQEIMKYCLEDEEFFKEIKKFYKEFYLFTSRRITRSALSKIALEDIFSLLDRSIKSAHKYKNFDISKFIKIENTLTNKIAEHFQSINGDDQYVKNFINKLIKFRLDAKDEDKLSVITLNWDNLIDRYLQNEITNDKIALDYCMFDYSFERQFDENIEHIPSIYLKVKGKKNLKLIKLHGSVNWNICHSCHKVYVNAKKITDKYICKPCEVELEKFMISPTFMKEFQTNHIKNIWHNAFMDISEASHIVFIGYSFPLADFEFKILLSRAIKRESNIKITVVDYTDKQRSSMFNELKERYQFFFGKNITFYNKGVKCYIEKLMDDDLDRV